MITQDKTLDKYTADGMQVAYPVTYPLYAATDVTVTLGAAGGAETVLTLNTDYSVTVSARGTGGTVTLVAAPAAGVVVAIALSLPLVQLLDLSSTATIDVGALEQELDQQVQMIQQTASLLVRAVTVPVTSDVSPDELVQQLLSAAEASTTAATEAAESAADAAESASLLAAYPNPQATDANKALYVVQDGDGTVTLQFKHVDDKGKVLRHVSYPLDASGAVAITYADFDFTPEEVPYPFFSLAAGKPYIVSLLTASLTGCTAQICHADGTAGVDVTPYAACGEQVCGDGTVCGQPVTQSIATLATYIPM